MSSSSVPQVPVVGIGASAGGIQALEGFFRGMPDEPGLAFVVVTHLNPERESILHEVISRYTPMPVHVAVDGERVRINCVYVRPADAILSIAKGILKLDKSQSVHRERKPIDVFLSALAIDQGEFAAAVVLSGADGDGTLGLKAVKERGGLTLAQIADGYGPSFDHMPASAIVSGFVDFAIAADRMGAQLVAFARDMTRLPGFNGASRAELRPDATDHVPEKIYAILRNHVGHDFGGYKMKTFMRRVQRRMQIAQLESVEAYIERLEQTPQEAHALFRDLLINVTNFFRDAGAFEKLAEVVIPKLFLGRGADETVRAWVPGCATGEEVFSIAILMREYMDTLTAVPRVQIFATDIDERSLSVARAGRYPEALLESVSAERRRRFFQPDGGSYVVAKEVRDLCVFSPHSVIRDPPFSRLDLVSCRNLLIYFGQEIQTQVIPTFHYALRRNGYLFLGTSENIGQFSDLFTAVEKKQRIFQRRDDHASTLRMPMVLPGLRSMSHELDTARRSMFGGSSLRQMVEAQVLERFAPPHVVANRDGDIVYYSTRTGKYLEAAAGVPTRNLLTMARKGLRLDLRTTFRQAVETNRTVLREGLAVESDEGRVQIVSVTVEPILERDRNEQLFLVLFVDQGSPISRDATLIGSAQDLAAERLERELHETRDRLQSLIEEYETALEELKSSNEELVSVNEELQSTNEEMEASKEELQSLNEELQTINGELSSKVEALDSANSDLRNLFESTQVATVFLDHDLVIRTFTPAVSRIFNIIPGDRGRPLTDLTSRIPVPPLADDVRKVFADGQPVERRIEHTPDTDHFLVRVLPYRDDNDQVDGVIVTFVDVTSLSLAEAHHRVLIAELNHRVKNMLTVVIAISEQTLRTAPTIESFRTSFVARVHAMSRSYELLSRENWVSASLHELIQEELSPFSIERTSAVGPELLLGPRHAISLGMILHELCTNAVKYGALSIDAGRLALSWTVAEAGGRFGLVFHWEESGGPPVQDPAKRGLGLKLVERETSYNLGGKARIEFAPTGLKAVLEFDLSGKIE